MVFVPFLISEGYEGKILIDDIYINKIELEMLRNSLTIILQDPILIEGNIRDNIDPSKALNDIKIIKLSNKVGLSNFLEFKNLDYKFEDNGNNISVGEKQLLCIARALIKKTKIILMDEATANID